MLYIKCVPQTHSLIKAAISNIFKARIVFELSKLPLFSLILLLLSLKIFLICHIGNRHFSVFRQTEYSVSWCVICVSYKTDLVK